jgi:hypothetical protein
VCSSDLKQDYYPESSLTDVRDLIKALAPLVASGNTRSLDYIDQILQNTRLFGAEGSCLVDQIENFDFPDAKKTLRNICGRLFPDEPDIDSRRAATRS